MNRTIKILKVITIIVLPILLQALASFRSEKRHIKEVQIDYFGNQNVYITDENIREILFNDIDQETSLKKNLLKINTLENRLDNNPMVENSEVYMTIDGILKTKIKQREPIARVFSGNNFYYLDNKGKQMPLSKAYSARVPLIIGTFSDQELEDIYRVAKHIYDDKFLSENITEIIVDKKIFRLKMRIANFDVILGDVSNLKIKFDNLKAFYKKANKDNILDKYTRVNLRYSNQVVCTKATQL
ncbi:cell division protein FtsQ/DivIB [Capnocytophaga catalasegens]|uniref:Cell division protein FtsQ n=1 Tax=Capnocytophaga catalasegens TaxID=1004260 RepID=A0AAV5APK7_9FLAO|nr:hypothetical protein [Capnocytophaga catalasegens]GIZ14831.1 cell division protein FtsQ [Capnocytophaga catalasegens]GJM49167.1 cell division protein FtsQ [Capnocytophaga catalasegens]GJM52620.1 cell division protein FtsQ [Capnocytophaga catalasegens]